MTSSDTSADRIPQRWARFDREMREETCHHNILGVEEHSSTCPHSDGDSFD